MKKERLDKILVDLGLDAATIAAAFLHDVIEDTPVSEGDIRKEFGEEVLELVVGVTKLEKIPFSSKREPWHGQSQLRSALFHLSAQPRCGQRFTLGERKLSVVSMPLIASCGFNILLCGEKTSAKSFFLP